MNFFTNPDWFGRPGPFAYNTEFIICAILLVALTFIIPILLRGKEQKTIKTILIVLWSVAVFLDLLKYGYSLISNIVSGTLTLATLDVPLWTCSMFLFLMPIALFCKKEQIARACMAFICSISFFAGIINFAMPCDESLFSFLGLHKTLYHYMLMLTPAIALGCGYFKLKLQDMGGIMATLVIFGIPVYVFNVITKQDYMFIYDGSWLPIDMSTVIPFKPLYTLLSLVLYALVALMMIGIDIGVRKLAKKRMPPHLVPKKHEYLFRLFRRL